MEPRCKHAVDLGIDDRLTWGAGLAGEGPITTSQLFVGRPEPRPPAHHPESDPRCRGDRADRGQSADSCWFFSNIPCWLFVAVSLKIHVMSATSPEPVRESLAESTLPDLPVDVHRFCTQHGLLRYLMLALDLVSRRFVLAERPATEIEQDPETGEQWVTVDIVVCGAAEEFFDRYDRYTDAFVAAIPWPERNQIRLSYCLG